MRALICGFCGAVLMFFTCIWVAGTWDIAAATDRYWVAVAVWISGFVAAAFSEITRG